MAFAACVLTGITASAAGAHEQWADGSPIPGWVNQFCCSVADAHQMTVKQIFRVEGGWRVEGYAHTIPDYIVLPSQDEHLWLFYRTHDNGTQSNPFCFFVPQGSI